MLAWGLVNEVAAEGQALARAKEIAAAFAAATDRATVAIAKRLMTFGADAPTRTARHLEFLADRSQSASEAFDSAFKGFGKKDG